MANWDRTSKTETECVIYVQNSNLREYIKHEFICIEQLRCFLLYICAGTCIIVYLYCNLHSAKNSMADDPIPSLEYLKIPEKELYKWGIRLADDHEAVVFMLAFTPLCQCPQTLMYLKFWQTVSQTLWIFTTINDSVLLLRKQFWQKRKYDWGNKFSQPSQH